MVRMIKNKKTNQCNCASLLHYAEHSSIRPTHNPGGQWIPELEHLNMIYITISGYFGSDLL